MVAEGAEWVAEAMVVLERRQSAPSGVSMGQANRSRPISHSDTTRDRAASLDLASLVSA